jgi:hypothetical protein
MYKEKRDPYKDLMGKIEGKRHLEDLNIDGDSEIDHKERGLENMQLINHVQKRNK